MRSDLPRPVRALALPERVDVRIASLERATEVRVTDSSAGALVFSREGDRVRCSDGRRARAFELEPRAPGAGLGLAERTYPGLIRIEPHRAGGLSVTNRVALEDYVAGVVAAELVLWSALPAELEAQAIAARTYAARALEDRGTSSAAAFLWDDTRDQAYRGRFVPAPTTRARAVGAGLEQAVRATRGRVLVREGQLFDARFHASCGGTTAAFGDIFPLRGADGGEPVACEPCARLARSEPASAPGNRVRWQWTASAGELERLAASLEVGRSLTALRSARVDAHGRWLAVELQGEWEQRRIDFDELRRRLGHDDLKSARIVSTWPRPGDAIRGGLRFEGVGRGHGVGLCQVGAREYAAQGWRAQRILAHYYPGATLRAVETSGRALARR